MWANVTINCKCFLERKNSVFYNYQMSLRTLLLILYKLIVWFGYWKYGSGFLCLYVWYFCACSVDQRMYLLIHMRLSSQLFYDLGLIAAVVISSLHGPQKTVLPDLLSLLLMQLPLVNVESALSKLYLTVFCLTHS